MTQETEPQQLIWEQLKSSRKEGRFFTLAWDVHRAKVPGGWLVLVVHNTSGLTFYPDPEHEWDGSSLT